MSLYLFVVFGLMIGLFIDGLTPRQRSLGLLSAAVSGILGALPGGVLGNWVGRAPLGRVTAPGVFGSVIGAALVVIVVMLVRHRSAART